jgi:CRP-like cAMP-binding protein
MHADSDGTQAPFHERITRQGEETITQLATQLLENPLINGAISRAFEAREKAAQAQEAALGALQLPTAADMERLTRRVRSVSQRLEGIEDSLDRVDERLASTGLKGIEDRLDALVERLEAIEDRLPEPKTPRRARSSA